VGAAEQPQHHAESLLCFLEVVASDTARTLTLELYFMGHPRPSLEAVVSFPQAMEVKHGEHMQLTVQLHTILITTPVYPHKMVSQLFWGRMQEWHHYSGCQMRNQHNNSPAPLRI
jgi:hypothetical protein